MVNTAAKYRPKTFDELAGQEFVVSTIKNSLKNGQVAHAYLFAGPRGCGKTSAARILARSLNCTNPSDDKEPCGTCDNCKAISLGTGMDVLEIDGASNNSVNDVRQIKDEVLFPPQSGKYKVYIIDEVHMLSTSAFNALLKTIEEPPPYIVFIFATTELHKVPATIKSRCQQFNFRLISIEIIQSLLKKICNENNIQAEEDALFWIARESTGSMRDAFTLFDQVVSFSSTPDGVRIKSDVIREKLGIAGLEKLNALAESCAENDAASAFALTDELLVSGVAIEQFVIDMAGYYRGLLLLKNGVTRESLLGYKAQAFSEKVLNTYDSIRLEQAVDILLDCYRNLRYCVSPRFELETAVSKLIWLTKWITPAELHDAVQNVQQGLPVQTSNLNSGPQIKPVPNTQVYSSPNSNVAPKLQTESSAGSSLLGNRVQNRSLAAEFDRMVAINSGTNNAASQSKNIDSAGANNNEDDDDEPAWRVKKEEKKNPPQVEKVLSILPGTVIN